MATKRVPSTAEAWEGGRLGRDEEFVVVADEHMEAELDATLGLQAISIRLPRQLIEQYKLIAHFHDVGYQPLMRDVLARFVPGALREILEAEERKATQAVGESSASPERRRKVA